MQYKLTLKGRRVLEKPPSPSGYPWPPSQGVPGQPALLPVSVGSMPGVLVRDPAKWPWRVRNLLQQWPSHASSLAVGMAWKSAHREGVPRMGSNNSNFPVLSTCAHLATAFLAPGRSVCHKFALEGKELPPPPFQEASKRNWNCCRGVRELAGTPRQRPLLLQQTWRAALPWRLKISGQAPPSEMTFLGVVACCRASLTGELPEPIEVLYLDVAVPRLSMIHLSCHRQ